MFILGRQVSLLFCKVVITEIARICSQLYLLDLQWVHIHLVDIEFPEDVAGTLATWAWGHIPGLSLQPQLQMFGYSQFPAQLSEIEVNVCGN